MALVDLLRPLRAAGASAPIAIILLLAANIIPLVGVLAFGWDVFTILILYWIENGIVGLFNVPKIVLAAAPSTRSADQPAAVGGGLGKTLLAGFFVLHYGVFWIGHGVFVLLLAGMAFSGLFAPLEAAIADRAVLLGAIALMGSHAATFAFNFVGRREYLRVSPGAQMFQPYPRMVVLHLTVLAGGYVVLQLDQPVVLIALMVLFKTGLDLVLHLREHWNRQAMPETA